MKSVSQFFLLFFLSIPAFSQSETYFLTDPAISPDGKEIAFVYENDIWRVDAGGGVAYRLTGLAGAESAPRYSPDGRWIAFSASPDGNPNIYVMPRQGGEARQLTWHDAPDLTDSWSWDSQYIYFTSTRDNTFAAFRVNINGSTPERLFSDHFYNQAHHMVEEPNGKGHYFTTSWESFTFPQRVGYVGENNPDILYYNESTKKYEQLTTWHGKDMWPTIDRKGNLYIASDEGNRNYNLYRLDSKSKTKLTSFSTPVYRPLVSADGSKIVFGKDYQIYLYDVASGESRKVEVHAGSFEKLDSQVAYNLSGKVTALDVSPDGKKLALVSRGRLFVSDIEGKYYREMPTLNTERVIEVKWLDDNSTLIFTRTKKGWANLYSVSANDPQPEKELTGEPRTIQNIEISSDRSKLAYASGTREIHIMNLKTFAVDHRIDDEFWFRGNTPRFSPDNNYLVYTANRNFEPDVLVYDLAKKSSFNITDNGVPENSPYWSPDGKYIYLSANRFAPGYPRGGRETNLYRIPLYRFGDEFRSDRYDELFTKAKPADSAKVEMKFDLDGVDTRWEQLRTGGNAQFSPVVFTEKDKTYIFYNETSGRTGRTFMKMELTPFDPQKTEKISDRTFSDLIRAGKKFYALIGGDVFEVRPDANKADKISLSYNFTKNFKDEFNQLFYENWSTLAEGFYHKDYHGVNWAEILAKYEKYLPYVRNRENLTRLQNDMLGELNSSHLGFSSMGDEQKTFYTSRTNATGIVFDNRKPYTVERILKDSPADLTGAPVAKGDVLVSVNGRKVDADVNREYYFSLPRMDDELTLEFRRNGKLFPFKLKPVSSATVRNLRQEEWIETNQQRVDRLSGKRIAYVHMKDMGDAELERFLIKMTSEGMHRDGLILDLRNNRGGNVHDPVIQFLSQRPYLLWQFRDGALSTQPNFAPAAKPIVVLINEQSLSDAEMTTAAFKQLGLGKVIGTETYRWIIFTSGKQMVDGSFTRLPAWGVYTLDGKNLEQTGVAPDIYVRNTFYDVVTGNDPQLDEAVKQILKELK